jgi:hypothetical protein
MMIPVQKDQFLSPENNEHSINELRHFAENKKHHPEPYRQRYQGEKNVLKK